MPYCPACGHHVAPGDATCSECGRSVAEALSQGNRGGGPAAAPAQDSGESQPPAAAEAPGQDGTTRRKALTAAGGVLGAMVLGTYAVERFVEDGPGEVVDAWRTAWADGDADTFYSLWHPDATQPDTWPEDALARPSEPDPSLEYIGEEETVLERTETETSVRNVFVLGRPEFETRRRHETVVDLRTADGSWRVFEERLEHAESVTNCRRIITINGPGRIECE